MSEQNGKSRKNPRSVDIPHHDPNEMLTEIWSQVHMTNIKLYGDKDKKIVGMVDELATLNSTMAPLVKDYERRKLVRRWVLIPLTFIGGAVGTWAKNYIETHYLK